MNALDYDGARNWIRLFGLGVPMERTSVASSFAAAKFTRANGDVQRALMLLDEAQAVAQNRFDDAREVRT
jgi:hypothetical protein